MAAPISRPERHNIISDYNGVGIAPTSGKHVPQPILDEVDELIKKIKSGTIIALDTKISF